MKRLFLVSCLLLSLLSFVQCDKKEDCPAPSISPDPVVPTNVGNLTFDLVSYSLTTGEATGTATCSSNAYLMDGNSSDGTWIRISFCNGIKPASSGAYSLSDASIMVVVGATFWDATSGNITVLVDNGKLTAYFAGNFSDGSNTTTGSGYIQLD